MTRREKKRRRAQTGETDFFGADLKMTRALDKEIFSIFNNLDEPLKKVGLRTGYFQLLVWSDNAHAGLIRKEEYIPFFDIGILPQAIFNLPDELRDAYAARAYFRSIVANPIGRIIREEFPEVGDTVGAFLERAKHGGNIQWTIPRADSPIIDSLIEKEGSKFLITLPEHTEPKRARSMLRQMYENMRTQNYSNIVEPISESDIITYGALLFCALGERLQKDWELNAFKSGYWKQQWEDAAAHFLAVKILGLSASSQADFSIEKDARAAFLSLKGASALSMATKFKRGGRLHEFFSE